MVMITKSKITRKNLSAHVSHSKNAVMKISFSCVSKKFSFACIFLKPDSEDLRVEVCSFWMAGVKLRVNVVETISFFIFFLL